mgnify:CR=1 FL=1
MRILLSVICLVASSYLSAQQAASSYCPKSDVVVKCRKALVPFKYTNMVTNRIVFKRFNYVKEISIPLFYDARYRLVFNAELLPKDIKIRIYDAPQTEKKREQLAEFESSQGQFTFEPDAATGLYEVYVDFLIPAYIAEDGSSFIKGCVILMTGYEDEVSDAFGDSGSE